MTVKPKTLYKQRKRAYESYYQDKFSSLKEDHIKAADDIINKKEELKKIKPIVKTELSTLDDQLTEAREAQNRNEEFLKRLNNKDILYIDKLINTDFEKDKSLNTRKVFKSRLNVIHKLIHNKPLQKDTTINDFIDYKKVIKNIDDMGNKSLQPFYSALLKLFVYHNENKVLNKEQKKAFVEYSFRNSYHKNLSFIKKHNLEYKTVNNPEVKKMITPKSIVEKKEWVDYEVLVDKYLNRNGDIFKGKNSLTDNFLIPLFLFLPVERYVFNSLKLYHPEDEYDIKDNVLIVDNNNNPQHIILNEYKTKNKYNQIIIDIEDYNDNNIKDEIKFYLDGKNIRKGEFIFNKEYRDNFGNKVKAVFKKLSGKTISINVLRKIYASDNWKFKRDADEMIEDAMILGHSIQTELSEYIKR